MSLQVIVGTQWGDEGKGRIVDWFASRADFCARYNGGDNAGHTVTVADQIYKLHLIPSGIIHPHVVAVLGNGMVINPKTLLEEMDLLSRAGIQINPQRLRLSYNAHLITPVHLALDRAVENARGAGSLGTTGRGIGPAYTDKVSRNGLRVGDLFSAHAREKVIALVAHANRTLQVLGAEVLDAGLVWEQVNEEAARLQPHVADAAAELHSALSSGKTVLAEGAQGTLLDVDFGSYPYVTSSTTTAPGALTGLGLGLDAARDARVVGVVKAFQTRVGSGPFPTEIQGQLADRLRGTGKNPWDEYGTTTGRPRRIGWLDMLLLKYAIRLNGIQELAVTKLDIVGGLKTLRLCTRYRKDGHVLNELEFGTTGLESVEPEYEDLPGWDETLSILRSWDDLPKAARAYLDRLAELAGVPVTLVSVGPEREQLITRG